MEFEHNLTIDKIVKNFEADGAFVIKFPSLDFLEDGHPLEFKHHVYVLPDQKIFFQTYMKQLEAWAQKNNKYVDKNLIESIIYNSDFPANISELPSEIPKDLQGKAYIHMISLYGDMLTDKMKRKGFSDDASSNMNLITHEALVNAFRHGNAGDPSKKIEYTEEYFRGNSKHGFMVYVKDEGLNVIQPENINASVLYSKSKPSLENHGRGFIFMKLFGDTVLVYPHKSGNFIYMDKFEDLPENLKSENLRNNYKQNHVA